MSVTVREVHSELPSLRQVVDQRNAGNFRAKIFLKAGAFTPPAAAVSVSKPLLDRVAKRGAAIQELTHRFREIIQKTFNGYSEEEIQKVLPFYEGYLALLAALPLRFFSSEAERTAFINRHLQNGAIEAGNCITGIRLAQKIGGYWQGALDPLRPDFAFSDLDPDLKNVLSLLLDFQIVLRSIEERNHMMQLIERELMGWSIKKDGDVADLGDKCIFLYNQVKGKHQKGEEILEALSKLWSGWRGKEPFQPQPVEFPNTKQVKPRHAFPLGNGKACVISWKRKDRDSIGVDPLVVVKAFHEKVSELAALPECDEAPYSYRNGALELDPQGKIRCLVVRDIGSRVQAGFFARERYERDEDGRMTYATKDPLVHHLGIHRKNRKLMGSMDADLAASQVCRYLSSLFNPLGDDLGQDALSMIQLLTALENSDKWGYIPQSHSIRQYSAFVQRMEPRLTEISKLRQVTISLRKSGEILKKKSLLTCNFAPIGKVEEDYLQAWKGMFGWIGEVDHFLKLAKENEPLGKEFQWFVQQYKNTPEKFRELASQCPQTVKGMRSLEKAFSFVKREWAELADALSHPAVQEKIREKLEKICPEQDIQRWMGTVFAKPMPAQFTRSLVPMKEVLLLNFPFSTDITLTFVAMDELLSWSAINEARALAHVGRNPLEEYFPNG